VTRTRPTSLRYSHYDGKAQVTCETEHDPAVLDSSTILYDPECEWKEKTAQAIAARNVANPSTRDLAERFARSGINFSCLFAAVNTTGASSPLCLPPPLASITNAPIASMPTPQPLRYHGALSNVVATRRSCWQAFAGQIQQRS
jgi:hypothetical protein